MTRTERTTQGDQFVLPGAERSALQLSHSRESAGRGKMTSAKPQLAPGPLFAEPEPERQERLL